MSVLVGNNIDREEWRRLVAASTTGTWFQGSEAFDFFAQQPSLFKPFFVAIEDCKLKNEEWALARIED